MGHQNPILAFDLLSSKLSLDTLRLWRVFCCGYVLGIKNAKQGKTLKTEGIKCFSFSCENPCKPQN